MSLYGAYLARVPPGRPRDAAWWGEARLLSGSAFFFGDYDLHHLVRIEDTLFPCAPRQLLQLAPEHQLVLLSPVPRAGSSDLFESWPTIAAKHPLCAYVEIKLQPLLIQKGTAVASVLAEAFLRSQISADGGVDVASFLGLSGPDLAFYLFANDLEAMRSIVAEMRSRTLGHLAAWLRDTVDEAQLPEKLRPHKSTLAAISSGFEQNHLCLSTYNLYGMLPHPDASDYDVETMVRRVTTADAPTALRPLVFISTFPGHEQDAKLRSALRACSAPGATVATTGLFDLVHQVVPPEEAGHPLTQREILRRTLDILTMLWDGFGPTSTPTIYRTTTLLLMADDDPGVTIPPHGIKLDVRLFEDLDLANLGAIGEMVGGLLRAYDTAASNHMTSSYVADLYPFLERLIKELRRLHDEPDIKKEHTPQRQAFHDAFNDVFVRVEAALVNRTHGTMRSLRAEILARPGASLQKLLGIYGNLCRSIVDDLRPLLDEDASVPEILYSVGGTHTARSHWYFGDQADCPALVIFETASAHILQPDMVVFPLTHELMHVLPTNNLKESLVNVLFAMAACRIARLARDHRLDLGSASEEALAARIKRAFHHDLADALKRGASARGKSKRRHIAARDLGRWSGRWMPYLFSLLYRDATGGEMIEHEPGKQPTIDRLAELDDLRAAVDRSIDELWQLAKEATFDVMAAFATSPDAYMEVMRRTEHASAERLELVSLTIERVKALAKGQANPANNPLVEALAAIGRKVAERVEERRRKSHGDAEFFAKLPGALSSGEGVLMLLSSYERCHETV